MTTIATRTIQDPARGNGLLDQVVKRQEPLANLVAETAVPGGTVITTAYSLPTGDFLQVEFVADAGGTYDPRRFSVASALSREYFPTAEDAETAAAAYHAQEVKRRRTFSAAWIGDMLLTGPEHARLPLDRLVAVALGELARRDLVDLNDQEDRQRAILDLEIGEWADPAGRDVDEWTGAAASAEG